jgi:hypothetical protein
VRAPGEERAKRSEPGARWNLGRRASRTYPSWSSRDSPLPASAETPDLLAIGDRKAMLVRTALTDGPLEWSSLHVDLNGGGGGQFERVAACPDGTVLLLLAKRLTDWVHPEPVTKTAFVYE